MARRIFRVFLYLLPAALLMGCRPSITPEQELVLSVEPTELNLSAEPQTATFQITCNNFWAITGATSWCSPDVSGGTGPRTITVTVTRNETGGNRTTDLTLSSGNKTARVHVLQIP